jgi:hypothetical protein
MAVRIVLKLLCYAVCLRILFMGIYRSSSDSASFKLSKIRKRPSLLVAPMHPKEVHEASFIGLLEACIEAYVLKGPQRIQ